MICPTHDHREKPWTSFASHTTYESHLHILNDSGHLVKHTPWKRWVDVALLHWRSSDHQVIVSKRTCSRKICQGVFFHAVNWHHLKKLPIVNIVSEQTLKQGTPFNYIWNRLSTDTVTDSLSGLIKIVLLQAHNTYWWTHNFSVFVLPTLSWSLGRPQPLAVQPAGLVQRRRTRMMLFHIE